MRKLVLLPLLVSSLLVCGVLTAGRLTLASEETVTVNRKSVDLREGTASYYKIVGSAAQGETLRVLERKNRWLKVTTPSGVTGWVFETALASSSSSIASAAKEVGASTGTGEAATADTIGGAKGLDESKRYAESKGLDYRAVEKVERFTVTSREVEAFIREGKLEPGGGS